MDRLGIKDSYKEPSKTPAFPFTDLRNASIQLQSLLTLRGAAQETLVLLKELFTC